MSRRSAIIRAFAAFTTADLLAYNASRDGLFVDVDNPTRVVPGVRVGELFLGMSERDAMGLLGLPESRQVHEPEDIETTARVFAYVNSQTGSNLTIDADYVPDPEITFIGYKSKGISLRIVHDEITAIFAYTGVIAGYDKGDYSSCFPLVGLPDLSRSIETLSDVRKLLGVPASESPLTKAPVPSNQLSYLSGISFDGRMDDGRISHVTITAPKPKTGG